LPFVLKNLIDIVFMTVFYKYTGVLSKISIEIGGMNIKNRLQRGIFNSD